MNATVAQVSLSRIAVAAPLGFLIGLSLGALGGGGSILAVPALVYGAGEGAKVATTSSLVVVGATSLVGMFAHLKAGRVRVLPGLGFGLVGIGGSFAGSMLNRAIPSDVLLLAFSGLILVAAWRMWSRHSGTPPQTQKAVAAGSLATKGTEGSVGDTTLVPGEVDIRATPETQPHDDLVSPTNRGDSTPAAPVRSKTRTIVRVVIAGSVVGLLTGFFGVGGGFVIVPALVLALGYEMPFAVGTSLLVIAVSSVEGLAFRLPSSSVDWRVVVPFTVAGIVGVLLGNRIAGRVPAARLSRWFVWLLLAVAAYTATQSLIAL